MALPDSEWFLLNNSLKKPPKEGFKAMPFFRKGIPMYRDYR